MSSINLETVLASVICAFFGGAGLVGLVVAYIRRFIDKRLQTREEINARRRAQRMKRLTAEDALERANGRLLFYVYKAVSATAKSKELEDAWAEYQDVERQMKAVDREILVENEMDV